MTNYSPIKATKIVHRKRTKWWGYIIYLTLLCCTIPLVYINFAQVFWFSITGPRNGIKLSANDVLSSLQLVAKLYEILVTISLGTLTLHAFRHYLVSDGIPFGLLTGAYRLFDIMYIVNPRFWIAAPQAIWLTMLLFISILLCALVGPASAILIVPKLGWFNLPGAFSNIYMPIVMAPAYRLWSPIMEGSRWDTLGDCRQKFGSFVDFCPSGGFGSIRSWASSYTFLGLSNNITFQDTPEMTRRLNIWSSGLNGTFVSTPTVFATRTLSAFMNYIQAEHVGTISQTQDYKLSLTNHSTNFQPLVNVKCNVLNLQQYKNTSEIPDIYYPYTELNCYSDDPREECNRMRDRIAGRMVPRTLLDDDSGLFKFSTIEGGRSRYNITLSSLVFHARLPYQYLGQRGIRVAACSYMAHWAPSELWAEPSTSDRIESNLTDLSVFYSGENWNEDASSLVGLAISIDKSWLPYLDLGMEVGAGQSNNSGNGTYLTLNTTQTANFENMAYLFDALMEQSTNENEVWNFFGPGSIDNATSTRNGDERVQVSLEKFTGAIITDAIARLGAEYTPSLIRSGEADGSIVSIPLANQFTPDFEVLANGTLKRMDTGWFPTNVEDVPTMTPEELWEVWYRDFGVIYFKAEQYGYGYGKSGGAVTFALAVIFAYLATLVISLIVMICRGTNKIEALGDLQDLVALAWKSPIPSSLDGQGINITNKYLWRENVTVKATPAKQVLMNFDESGQHAELFKLQKEEEYL